MLVSGEAARAQPGDATLHLPVSDLNGKKITSGQAPLMYPGGDALPFSTNIGVPPGSYIVRIGVIDSAGRVGSVDHRVDVRDVTLGSMTATGPMLVRVPPDPREKPGSRWTVRDRMNGSRSRSTSRRTRAG